jgi:hypothetical protein
MSLFWVLIMFGFYTSLTFLSFFGLFSYSWAGTFFLPLLFSLEDWVSPSSSFESKAVSHLRSLSFFWLGSFLPFLAPFLILVASSSSDYSPPLYSSSLASSSTMNLSSSIGSFFCFLPSTFLAFFWLLWSLIYLIIRILLKWK